MLILDTAACRSIGYAVFAGKYHRKLTTTHVE